MKPSVSSKQKLFAFFCVATSSAAALAEETIKHEVPSYFAQQTKPKDNRSSKAQKIVKIEISGRKFDIPIEYTYSQTFEKIGHWPQAKAERITTQSINLSALLPDLRPYNKKDDATWKEPGHGQRIEISIKSLKIAQNWLQIHRNRYIDGANKFATRQADVHNLIRYSVTGMEDAYFPADENIQLSISCDSRPPSQKQSPSCRTKSNYKSGIVIEYNYSSAYLSMWHKIDAGIRKMHEKFEKSANQ